MKIIILLGLLLLSNFTSGQNQQAVTGFATGNNSLTTTDAKEHKEIIAAEAPLPFAPIKNLKFRCQYVTPYNCYSLSWSPPDSSPTDTVVGYNIYRNNKLYLFTTLLWISCDPCIGSTNTTYCGFLVNPTHFFMHVTAVYNKSHIESAYTDSVYNNGCGTIIGLSENSHDTNLQIFPNPFSAQTVIQAGHLLKNADLIIDNCFGQTVRQLKNISGQTIMLNRDDLASGLYFIRLIQDSKLLTIEKLVVTDN